MLVVCAGLDKNKMLINIVFWNSIDSSLNCFVVAASIGSNHGIVNLLCCLHINGSKE